MTKFQYSAVVVDLNSTAIQAALSSKDTPSISIAPVYSTSKTSSSPENIVFDPLVPSSDDDEIYTLFSEGILYNKNATAPLLKYIYESLNLSEDSFKELPLAIAQNAWFDKKQLTKLSEIVFEELQVPIFSVLERQLCTAYAMSKPSNCIIVDFENDYLSVTPISNGKVIRKGISKSPFAGNYLNLFVNQFLNKNNISETDLLPVDYKKLSNLEKISSSFKTFAISQTLNDFKKSILDVTPQAIDAKVFKTPGNVKYVNVERLDQINNFIQPIFSPYDSYIKTFGTTNPVPSSITPESEGMGQLIFKSLKNIGGQSQVYSDLLNNLIIQGDMTFIPGLEEFILNDLRLYIKDYQISSYLNQDNMDRGIETWIGANILSKFEDLYISRQLYLENGHESILSRFA
ncbi:general RNA polymerase II transcription factor [Pichia californica]|uniref:General RNA polymerase II transcription factor n=1 Tax=Pichia californica TaxID=460514 RepID=A0A9P7BDW2_9ASCO|nr:general RNA polymerase II transcription factor [[Candida] californica]KAG0687271.1 general RNA polymerase II transcription factor [[Candida] californica]